MQFANLAGTHLVHFFCSRESVIPMVLLVPCEWEKVSTWVPIPITDTPRGWVGGVSEAKQTPKHDRQGQASGLRHTLGPQVGV